MAYQFSQPIKDLGFANVPFAGVVGIYEPIETSTFSIKCEKLSINSKGELFWWLGGCPIGRQIWHDGTQSPIEILTDALSFKHPYEKNTRITGVKKESEKVYVFSFDSKSFCGTNLPEVNYKLRITII